MARNCFSVDGLRITDYDETPAGAIELSFTECGVAQTETASFGSAWNGNHLVLGIYHIWVHAGTGVLMINDAAPANDDDGVAVGDQT